MAMLAFPELENDERFPDDVKQRARRILQSCGGGSVGTQFSLFITDDQFPKFLTLSIHAVKLIVLRQFYACESTQDNPGEL